MPRECTTSRPCSWPGSRNWSLPDHAQRVERGVGRVGDPDAGPRASSSAVEGLGGDFSPGASTGMPGGYGATSSALPVPRPGRSAPPRRGRRRPAGEARRGRVDAVDRRTGDRPSVPRRRSTTASADARRASVAAVSARETTATITSRSADSTGRPSATGRARRGCRRLRCRTGAPSA